MMGNEDPLLRGDLTEEPAKLIIHSIYLFKILLVSILRIYTPSDFLQTFGQRFHHFLNFIRVRPVVWDIGANVCRMGFGSAMEPENRVGALVRLAPSGEPGFEIRAQGDDQGRASQVFHVAGAELESVRLATARNDAYRFKSFTTKYLNPIFNDAET